MQRNYSEQELRTTIIKEKIYDHVYHYSVCKKQQKSWSIFSNDRLLVLDFDQGKLFYVNEVTKLPFRNTGPQPKKQFTFLDSTTATHSPNTNKIDFNFFFNNQRVTWKFQFQTNQLADQWMRLIQFQKQSKQTQEKDLRALNKSIIEMPQVEKEVVQDIVKEPQRDIPNDESKLLNQLLALGQSRAISDPESRINMANSRLSSPKNQKNKPASSYYDWNERFYLHRNIETLYQFKKVAVDAFFSSFKQDDSKKSPLREYENTSCTVKIANKFTPEAKRLKNEYRNFHFILQATNKRFIAGVPLACLVQFECVVGLVKARFPEKAEVLPFDALHKQHFNELERYTRIKNKILQKATLLNLSALYDPNIPYLMYANELPVYLPNNYEFPNEETLVRPEYMLDHVDYFIYSSHTDKNGKAQTRQMKQLAYKMVEKVQKFSNSFFLESFPVVTIGDLKNIIHDAGFNLKFLPHIYHFCSSAHIKQYIYSAMTAKVFKDYINQTLIKIKNTDDRVAFEPIIEETFSILLSGNNNRSHELWKQIALLFKKKYNLVLNHKDILPGFFFNSLLELIPSSYDIGKINKNKRVFEETRVFEAGFIKTIQPKVKCLDRFLSEDLQQLKKKAGTYIKSLQVCEEIRRKLFNEKDKTYQSYYEFGNNDQWMTEYLSLYYPPQNIASERDDKITYLFDRINEQPPSYFSLTLTKNYLEWCNKKEKTQEFKSVFQGAMSIADYWLDEIHPIRSDLLEVLSDYYSILGANEDMIKFMKDSLTISIKFWGPDSLQTGLKQYELGDRLLRGGRKKDAVEMLNRSKQNLEKNKAKTNKLGLIYMKLASIYLSDLQYDKATELGKQSIEAFQEYERKINSLGLYNEPYKIKAYEIMSRVYEICDQRTDYKQLALSCARKFNLTKNKEVYEQMVRICLASVIFRSTVERSENFLRLVNDLDAQARENPNSQRLLPIEQLMKMSEDMVVMEKFIYKFQFMERSVSELGNRKKILLSDQNKEFLHILNNIIAIVGPQYIAGLVQEKSSYGN